MRLPDFSLYKMVLPFVFAADASKIALFPGDYFSSKQLNRCGGPKLFFNRWFPAEPEEVKCSALYLLLSILLGWP